MTGLPRWRKIARVGLSPGASSEVIPRRSLLGAVLYYSVLDLAGGTVPIHSSSLVVGFEDDVDCGIFALHTGWAGSGPLTSIRKSIGAARLSYSGPLPTPVTIKTSAGKLIPRSVEYSRRASSTWRFTSSTCSLESMAIFSRSFSDISHRSVQ
jgi:hypothetical protein